MERTAPGRRAAAGPLLLVVAAAAALRMPGLNTEPWLDEVWSISLARRAASAADVFFKIRHDNSNPLNTLYLHFVPDGHGWAPYRLLSFACGLLTVALLGWDAEDPARGLLAAALAAVSAPMVLYGTEARGYALAALLALVCYRLLRTGAPLPRPRATAFSFCVLLGFLSHPTFVYVFAALAAWTAVRLPREKRARGLLVLFGAPAAVFGLYELLQLPVEVGGAGSMPLRVVLVKTLALWSGAPSKGAAACAGGAALLGLLAWELRALRSERRGEFFFFAALFAGALALAAVFPFPFERHFFVCLPFALLLAASGLTRLFRRGGVARTAAVAAILLFFAGNFARVRALNRDGRGHYLEAVRRMAADTPGDAITVSSDHDFRNKMLLDFYAAALKPPKRLEYVDAAVRKDHLPDWFLLHSAETDPRVAPIGVTLEGLTYYGLVDVYPYGGLSGWTWMLYRRSEAGNGPPEITKNHFN